MPAANSASATAKRLRLKRRIERSFTVMLIKFNVRPPASFNIPSGVTASGVQRVAGMPVIPSSESGRRMATLAAGILRASAMASGKRGSVRRRRLRVRPGAVQC